MIPQSAILIVLVLLLCATVASLWLDAREKRFDRQLTTVLKSTTTESLPTIRRSEAAPRSRLIYLLVDYRPELSYSLHPAYVLLAAFVVASAIFYVVDLFDYPISYGSIAAAIAAVVVSRGLFGWQRRRFTDRLFRQLPDTIQIVTSTVRSGLPVQEAFRTIARDMPEPTAGQFAIVCSELGTGRAPDEAVEAVYRRTGVTEYGIFAVTLGVQLKSGGSLSETLQTLGETISQRVALAARAKALAGEVIFSSRALTFAPLIIGGIIYKINPQSIEPLFQDPIGNNMLAYAVVSVVTGHFVIRWLIRRETTL
ncbi:MULTISPECIES: type II secretion system F family protein [Bradyrhizobium]|jgi:tight adherence protein B|uniref:type II secretion system F family protein n=1 Tax=Bradyrhizobium TaxID=374 RepID=UPI00293F4F33|nr:type II secretion system F family protein [Bradyrhizobium sp. NDS-1]WOH75115.1 type II secretion system F family protein [Bradyrhizobium sp. NDS-1]